MHPLTDDWIKKKSHLSAHTDTNTNTGILVSLKKEGHPVIWDNVAEPRGNYAR